MSESAHGRETVILVHGLWVHGALMALMRSRIAHCGYRAVCYSYPSVRLTLTENAERLAGFCRTLGVERPHFVGHSLGGLVVLKMMEHGLAAAGRIVLAGTPFAGSLAAHRLARLPGGRAALGSSLRQWLREPRPTGLGRFDIGVIAGSLGAGLGRLVAPGLPQPNDGVVSVAETLVPEMRDHIVLRVSHATMLASAGVTRQICAFLRHGAFAHAGRTVPA